MDIAQSFGSSSSYARKYALNGLFLIEIQRMQIQKHHRPKQKEKFTDGRRSANEAKRYRGDLRT